MLFPTPETHPTYPWQQLTQQPTTIFAKVPAHGGQIWLFVLSRRTGETYQKLCSDPSRLDRLIVDFARQHG